MLEMHICPSPGITSNISRIWLRCISLFCSYNAASLASSLISVEIRSMLYIETADRPGLLLEIVKIITDTNIDVESAEIDTEVCCISLHCFFQLRPLKPVRWYLAFYTGSGCEGQVPCKLQRCKTKQLLISGLLPWSFQQHHNHFYLMWFFSVFIVFTLHTLFCFCIGTDQLSALLPPKAWDRWRQLLIVVLSNLLSTLKSETSNFGLSSFSTSPCTVANGVTIVASIYMDIGGIEIWLTKPFCSHIQLGATELGFNHRYPIWFLL